MLITERNLAEFAAQSYTFVPQLISEADQQRLCRRALDRSRTNTMPADTRVPGTPAAAADPCMEELLEKLAPAMEQITGRKLFPTYSYFRVYKNGDVLGRHTDRPACEISVSVNLGYRADAPWPIWIEGLHGPGKIEMQAGDAVVYRGIDCPHWRDAFQGEYAAQVFLHYVDQHGPYAEWKFDRRPHLATIPVQPVRLAPHVLQPDGVLKLDSSKSVRLNPFLAHVITGLDNKRSIPEVIQHAVREFRISEYEAEDLVLKYVSWLEEKGILFFNSPEVVSGNSAGLRT